MVLKGCEVTIGLSEEEKELKRANRIESNNVYRVAISRDKSFHQHINGPGGLSGYAG